MTGGRGAKGKRKGKGSAAAAATEMASDRNEGVDSTAAEVRNESKRRSGSPGAAEQRATPAATTSGWLSCVLVVSIAVGVGAAACVFYGDAILLTLEKYGVDTDSVLRGLYPKGASEDAAPASAGKVPPSSAAYEATPGEREDSVSSDNSVGPSVSTSRDELPIDDDEATLEQREKRDEAAAGADFCHGVDSEEPAAAEAAAAAEQTYKAVGLDEVAAPADAGLSVGDGVDDVILTIGEARDVRPPADGEQAASPAAAEATAGEETHEARPIDEPAAAAAAAASVAAASQAEDGAAVAAMPAMPAESHEASRAAGSTGRGSTKKPYHKRDLTSAADNFIRRELDAGDKLVDRGALHEAKEAFEKMLRRYPASPRSHYGLARTLDAQSEMEQSNAVLEAAITWYEKLLQLADVPDSLYARAAERLADRQHFRGWSSKAVSVRRRLVAKFPDRAEYKNKLGVQLLLANKPLEAKLAFRQVLMDKPDDGFAKVHLGFILKTSENDLAAAVPLLRQGIDSGAEGVIDGRFFFHLGDAYQRLGLSAEAAAVYGRGAEHGLFLSAWQRSLYNVDRLSGRPWWSIDQLPRSYQLHLRMLAEHWETIRAEGLAQIDAATGLFVPEEENLRKNGTWKQYTLYSQGRKHPSACGNAPKTCALIDSIPEAATCKRGQVKFSLMLPGTHVWPHCGPTNCRIRAHLGLVVPDGPKIRVQEEIRHWSEGEFIIFDDSFEHEVWHTGTERRLVLIVDLWHPELTEQEKRTMSAI